jgi:RNA polymerase sigma-70 factor (ECF subfamily)
VISIAESAGRADTRQRRWPADRKTTDDSDEALMLAYGRGDPTAFERLYLRHKGPTYRYFLRHTSDRTAADELHQDVWLRVVQARERYKVDALFTTWLYTLARHRLVDHWRTRRGASFESLDTTAEDAPAHELPGDDERSDVADPLSLVIGAQDARRLLDALSGVPPAQRDAFLLHVEAGLPLGEIASLAGVPVETVKSRLRYAYRRLRSALEDLP